MPRLGIAILALVMILGAGAITITHYGDARIGTHESCQWCIKDAVDYPCHCETITEWEDDKNLDILFWILYIGGILLLLLNMFVFKEDMERG